MEILKSEGEADLNMADREDTILRLRARGFTLAEVGEFYGLTRERVRQIEAKADPDGTKVRALVRERTEEFAGEVADTILATASENPEMALHPLTVLIRSRIPRGIWIGENEVREVLGPEAMRRRHAAMWSTRPEKARTWSDEDIHAAMREVYEATGKGYLSVNAYRRAEIAEPLKRPSSAMILQRYEFWNAACEAAGIPAGKPLVNRVYVRRWTADVCVEAVAEFLRTTDGSPSAANYDEWSRGNEDAPSMATVRNRVGRWNEILKLAFQKIEGGTDEASSED